MTALTPVTINGLNTINGQPLLAQAEYTSGPILQQYTDSMQVFNDIFNLSAQSATTSLNGLDPNSPNGALTYAQQMQASIAALNNIAANGVPDPSLKGFNQPQRLTVQMASAMDQLYKTLNAAGIPTDGSAITAQQVTNWRNLAYSSTNVQSALSSATLAVGVENTSLQAMTELVYVQEGNTIISNNLNNLQNALSTTNDVLQTLNNVQLLANQKTALNKMSFQQYVNQVMGASAGVNWMNKSYAAGKRLVPAAAGHWASINASIYQIMLSSNGGFYGYIQKVNGTLYRIPVTKWALASGKYAYYQKIVTAINGYFIDNVWYNTPPTALRLTIASFVADPSLFGYVIPSLASKFFGGVLSPQVSSALNNSINPYVLQFLDYRQKIAAEIKQLSAISPNPNDPQSLLGTLRAVYSSMNLAIKTNNGNMPAALKMWILDGQSGASNSPLGPVGNVQTQINNAITAGQNLNSQQTEQTRQYLFLFEQFYQSASSILSSITQLIEDMAKGAGR